MIWCLCIECVVMTLLPRLYHRDLPGTTHSTLIQVPNLGWRTESQEAWQVAVPWRWLKERLLPLKEPAACHLTDLTRAPLILPAGVTEAAPSISIVLVFPMGQPVKMTSWSREGMGHSQGQ